MSEVYRCDGGCGKILSKDDMIYSFYTCEADRIIGRPSHEIWKCPECDAKETQMLQAEWDKHPPIKKYEEMDRKLKEAIKNMKATWGIDQ